MKRFYSLLLLFCLFSLSIQAKKALIFGITGQDGSYLAELLLEKGYEVHGVKRRHSSFNTHRIDHLYRDLHCKTNFILHYGDLSDQGNIIQLIRTIQPDEIYNLGAQSHVKVSFDLPEFTSNVTAIGTLRILEAIRTLGLEKKTKFYQASSSEMYGKVQAVPQNERTPFYPRSPYAVAKLFAHSMTVNYRESYGIFGCSGILFNHESPRRGDTFVTKKIASAAVKIKLGKQDALYLGNLDAKRDWGYAPDYVKAMWLMLQQEQPDDYVVATGETHSVKEFVELAFKEAGIELEWRGEGINEKGYDKLTNKAVVHIDPKYFRPAEVDLLIGDASKAKEKLGWTPSVTFEDLVKIMVSHEFTVNS